jgi:hypothetical protein
LKETFPHENGLSHIGETCCEAKNLPRRAIEDGAQFTICRLHPRLTAQNRGHPITTQKSRWATFDKRDLIEALKKPQDDKTHSGLDESFFNGEALFEFGSQSS